VVKKIIVGVFLLLIIGYACFVQYKDFNNTKKMNYLIKEKLSVNNDYKAVEDKIKELNEELKVIDAQKVEVTAQIKVKEDDLKRVNQQVNNRLAVIAQSRKAQAKYNIANNSGTRMAYLTFDDGPSGYTDTILNILKDYGVKATFFVNGRTDANSYRLYQRIVNEGHAIGNHIYTHNYQTIYSTVGGFDYQFDKLENLIQSLTGVRMDILRFPGGSNNTVSNSYNRGIMNTLTARYRSLGYVYFDWNVSSGDSASPKATFCGFRR
jgi:peptidoglycan/xylan/chitin deacetylase (PgdA/CDA1 family)